MSTKIIECIHNSQCIYFKTGTTKLTDFRLKSLKKLRVELRKREADIHQALYRDFKKSEFESVISETSVVNKELATHIKKLTTWSRPERVGSSMLNFPSSDYIYKEPYGSVLIIAPWNYPFQLAMVPLIGAVASGNTVVLKPSELTTNTSKIIKEICEAVFDKKHLSVLLGGVEMAKGLLEKKWDYIFFTGSTTVGKIVAKAAAEHLTPATLELGGKNPCIIDKSVNIKTTARRLVWAKFLNGGQTCIAPDYLLVHTSIKKEFIDQFKNEIKRAYGEDPQTSEDFPRIINSKNFTRLKNLLSGETILAGGLIDETDLYVAPTLLDEPSLSSTVMQEEIFGPILPILSFDTEEDIRLVIDRYPKPLAFYVFSKRKSFVTDLLHKHSFGGCTVNDAIIHYINEELPFGGVGESGIGAYHGKRTFDTFTHHKAVTKKVFWPDIPVRYAPYKGKLKLMKFILKYL
ncbi:MAG: aldehyde dehydrogenase [Maribacter sp.]